MRIKINLFALFLNTYVLVDFEYSPPKGEWSLPGRFGFPLLPDIVIVNCLIVRNRR
jgi:hypothetical protein